MASRLRQGLRLARPCKVGVEQHWPGLLPADRQDQELIMQKSEMDRDGLQPVLTREAVQEQSLNSLIGPGECT